MKPLYKYIFWCILVTGLYQLPACSLVNQAQQTSQAPLQATFTTYYSVGGGGKGIIFRVSIPDAFSNRYSIDSFYLGGKSYPFTIVKKGEETWLEANYYVVAEQPVYHKDAADSTNLRAKEITDPVIIEQKFYPSWVTVTGKTKKERFEITSYREVIPATRQ